MKKIIAIAVLALGVVNGATAHGAKPKHGGVIQTVDDVSYELVNKDGKAVIHVDDHGTGRSTAGASGTMTVLTGGKKSDVVLASGGGNMLVSKSKVQLQPGSKAIAAITFKGKEAVRVRFAFK